MIRRNIQISKWVDGFADGIDIFFVGRRVTKQRNETSLRLENTTLFAEAEKALNFTSVSVNLRLPNVEKYWQLKFTSYDEADERRRASQRYVRTTPRQQNYGATVGFFRKLGDVKVSFQPRIALEDPLQVSHSIVFESIGEYKAFQFNPKFELFARPSTGTGVFLALNFHYAFDEIWSLTFVNEGEYRESLNAMLVTNGLSLGQQLTDQMSFAYNIFVDSSTRPNYHMDGYTFSVAWNHILYNKILDYQITPYMRFARAVNFRGSPGLTFNVSLNF